MKNTFKHFMEVFTPTPTSSTESVTGEGPADEIRPRHYTDLRPEPIDVIECWKLGFHLGNAVKYIARAGRKCRSEDSSAQDGITDLEKAAWYLEREISCRKALEEAKREHVGI